MDNNSSSLHSLPITYIVSQELAQVASLLPSNKNRSKIVHALVSALGLFRANPSQTQGEVGYRRALKVTSPTPATEKDLLVYHDREFVSWLLDKDQHVEAVGGSSHHATMQQFGLEEDCPPFAGLDKYVSLVAGGALTAVSHLRNGHSDIAILWDGGRHHALKARASGFCYVADCVLAIMALRKPITVQPSDAVFRPRIMYIDLDLHFSDGVSSAFASQSPSNARVLTLSIHHASAGFFPASPRAQLPSPASPTFDPFNLSIPLARGASDATFMRIWPIVERVKDAFRPDFIVLQCGVDGLAEDPCKVWNWSLASGEGSMAWCVKSVLGWDGKKLLLGGGGYHTPNAARAWGYLTSLAMGRELALDTNIPDHAAFPLYAPSFTIDISSNRGMRDENSEEYLQSIEGCYEAVVWHLLHIVPHPQGSLGVCRTNE